MEVEWGGGGGTDLIISGVGVPLRAMRPLPKNCGACIENRFRGVVVAAGGAAPWMATSPRPSRPPSPTTLSSPRPVLRLQRANALIYMMGGNTNQMMMPIMLNMVAGQL